MSKNTVQATGFVAADIAVLEATLQKYKELALEIEAAVPHNLTSETDEQAVLKALIKPSENLYQVGVKLRNQVSDLSKKFIGQTGSIADQAVQRRKALFAKKAETKETETKTKEAESAK